MLEFMLVESSLLVSLHKLPEFWNSVSRAFENWKSIEIFWNKKKQINSLNTNHSEGCMWSAFTKEGVSAGATKWVCMEHQCLPVMW